MNVELKHTLTVPQNAWYIRLFLFFYGDDDGGFEKITFCKLFWGYLAMPFVALLYLVLIPSAAAHDGLDAHKQKKQAKRTAQAREYVIERKAPKPPSPWQQALLSGLETSGARFVLFVRAVGHALTLNGRITALLARIFGSALFGRILVGAGALAALVFVGALVWVFSITWSVSHWVLIGLGGIMVIVLLIALLLKVGAFVAFADKLGEGFGAIGRGIDFVFYRQPFIGLVNFVQHSVIGFGRTMRIGYVAVKSNTCPRIELKG